MTEIDFRIGIVLHTCTVLKLLYKDSKHRTYLFKCGHCGTNFKALYNNVKKGNTKSCGCQKNKNPHKTHGMSNSRIYNVWRTMIYRCELATHISYKNYGARGISVCKRWHKFENFLEDMGIPLGKLDIDRIDNNGNYEKNNCKWSSRKENSNNKRNSTKISWNGIDYSIGELSHIFNLNEKCLRKRLRMGWQLDKALKTPSGKPLPESTPPIVIVPEDAKLN